MHTLDDFLEQYSSKREAYNAIYQAIKQKFLEGTVKLFTQGKMTNLYEEIVKIGKINVTVRGRLVENVIYLATAFIKKV